ncbi:HAMP domain-containing histidine kinase [Fructobacillus sp. M2-14]|uniref:histidine kinase n=1 Tax=Fructobacillus broussonetiae TaxID=2713173 RepID=A0ABS5QZX3_9LACO|nr:HAMP domain-containing sensor histidine kinase [Fructobacillus broussonetiae]MBS9338736.1 HAMP domain-containing histidine kinase [Fructobacillus broussonetiae]
MIKTITLRFLALVKVLLELAFSAAVAWVLLFDWLKVRPTWSVWTGWPSFCFLTGGIFFLFLLLKIPGYRKGRTLKKLTNDLRGIRKNQLGDKKASKQVKKTKPVALLDDVLNGYQERERTYQKEAASKEEMMTNISHDLRTPLTAIIGYLGLVATPNSIVKEGDQQKYIETAYHKANQMKVLVEDLFEFAKLQSSQVNLNITDFSLGDLFEQVLANYAMEAKDKQIQLTTQLAPKLIVMAGDSEKLARVLINLVENGLKYGAGASFIKLTAQEKDDGQVEIRVINDGPAIPKEAQEQLFDRFYRVESSRNAKTGGTGLGLSIVKGVIDQHKGEIHVESNDELTAFIMTLPKKQRKEAD